MNFSKAIKVDPILSYASGSADRTSDIVDTQAYGGVAIVVHFAAIAAGAATSLRLFGSRQSDMSSPVELTQWTTSVGDADDNEIFLIDVVSPPYRYLRLTVDKDAVNASGESAVAYLYMPQLEPVTHPADANVRYAAGV